MKGLRKYLSPFTPDQSGAVSVLFHYGGMLIIMDAGGCVGNICGYDEPRWEKEKSAIFSAGLRDLDAILGRDELLIKKTKDALRDVDAKFVGLIGTPVPSVIATDYRALKRLMEEDYGLPVVSVETNGIDLYDDGISKAFLQLFKSYVPENGGSGAKALNSGSSMEAAELSADEPVEDGTNADTDSNVEAPVSDADDACSRDNRTGCVGRLHLTNRDAGDVCNRNNRTVGVIGFTPLDTPGSGDYSDMLAALAEMGIENPVIYGINDDLAAVGKAARVSRNIVVSPGGIKAARWLRDRFGVPYEIRYPLPEARLQDFAARVCSHNPTRVLIIHQQVLANSLRSVVLDTDSDSSLESVDVASWFMLDKEARFDSDVKLNEEDDLMKLVEARGYDMIIGDPLLTRVLPGWQGTFLSLPHFAISASLYSADTDAEYWEKAGEVL